MESNTTTTTVQNTRPSGRGRRRVTVLDQNPSEEDITASQVIFSFFSPSPLFIRFRSVSNSLLEEESKPIVLELCAERERELCAEKGGEGPVC